MLALSLYTAAFVADAINMTVSVVPPIHTDYALLLGQSFRRWVGHVVLPQTWKPTVVAVGRVLTTMVKNSAIGGFFGVAGDLSNTADQLTSVQGHPVLAILLGVSLAYLAMTMPLVIALDRLERSFGGSLDAAGRRTDLSIWLPRMGRGWAPKVVNGALMIGGLLYLLACRPLLGGSQLDYDRWSPMIRPTDPSFPLFWHRVGDGVLATMLAASLAIGGSLLWGTALGVDPRSI